MLPTYYEFQNSTKILSGKYALENITYELKGLGASRKTICYRMQRYWIPE